MSKKHMFTIDSDVTALTGGFTFTFYDDGTYTHHITRNIVIDKLWKISDSKLYWTNSDDADGWILWVESDRLKHVLNDINNYIADQILLGVSHE